MSTPYEVEIKLKVQSPRTFRKKLERLGFVVIGRRKFEDNIVFDFNNSRLKRARTLIRLRSVDHQHLLTYKGAPRQSGSYKIRMEIETVVGDEDALQSIFEAVGLHPVFQYQKYRTVYAPKRRRGLTHQPLVLYDETPIGAYAELEGPRRWIDAVARQLGYERGDYIKASYATLYQKHCRQRNIKPSNMVFRSFKS
jgi:adenylate cyclase, class 2